MYRRCNLFVLKLLIPDRPIFSYRVDCVEEIRRVIPIIKQKGW